MADHFLGALQAVPMPASPHDFPLGTTEDLRRAYRDYAKANDERLIFDGDQLELSPLGRDVAFQNWNAFSSLPEIYNGEDKDMNMLVSGDLFVSHQLHVSENRYWETLKQRIDTFITTPEGQNIARILYNELWQFLISTMFHDGNPPDDLYERVVAAELCWRAQVRATHKVARPELYESEPPMKITIIESFNPDGSIKSTETLRVPSSHTFNQFCRLLSHHSGIPLDSGTDLWHYEDPLNSDICSDDHFKPIISANYSNLRKLLIEAPKQEARNLELTVWHETQIAYVRSNIADLITPNILEQPVEDSVLKGLEREFVASESNWLQDFSSGDEENGDS